MAGSTTLLSQGQAGSSVRSSAGCNAGGCGRYAAGPSEPDLVGSDWSAWKSWAAITTVSPPLAENIRQVYDPILFVS